MKMHNGDCTRRVLRWIAAGMAATMVGMAPGCGGNGGGSLELALSGCPGDAIIAGNSFSLTAMVLDADGNDVSNTATYTVTASGATFQLGVVTQQNLIEITIPADAVAQTVTINITASLVDDTSGTESCAVRLEANPCGAEGAACDDQDPCTADDMCSADFECVGTPIDCDDGNACTDDSCDPVDGMCINEPNTDSCDDGDACTENDSCADGECAGEEIMCPDGEACLDGDCVAECITADDCDDLDACTDDACVDGLCSNSPIDPALCDDDDACTEDSCDADNGCVNEPVVCDDGFACSPDSGECEEASCIEDTDCDDGEFCNGLESCLDGICVAGTDPCADAMCSEGDPECLEGDDAAICACPPVEEPFEFTLGQDNLTGSTNDDVYFAPLQFNAATGVQLATLQTADFANGLAGHDMCSASFTGGEAPLPNLQGIEEFQLGNFNANASASGTSNPAARLTMNAANISGADTFLSVNSTSDIVVTGLNNLVDFGMRNVQNAAVDMAVEFAVASVTSGSDDEISFSVGSTVGDGVVVIPAGVVNGLERLHVESAGAGELNTITTLRHVQQDGTPNTYLDNPLATSLTSMSFAGTSPLNTQVVPDSVVTLDGSGMANDWTLGSGSGTAIDPYAAFHANNQKLAALTGGNGNDWFIFATQLTDADAAGLDEFIDGGPGFDAVQATMAANIAAVAPFLSIEQLYLNATGGNRSLNLTGVSGIVDVIIDGAAGGVQADQITLLNIGGAPLPTIRYRGDGAQAGQGYDPLNYSATGVGGANDSVMLTVDNRSQALNQNGVANVHAPGAITLPNIETLTFDIQDGPATFNGVTASTLTTVSGTAVSDLTLGTIGTGGVGGTLTSINFSGVVGNLAGTFTDCANGMSLTSSAGNDNIVVANSAAMTSSVVNTGAGDDTFESQDVDSQDVISSGAGADILTPLGGDDILTPGAGNDVIIYSSSIGGAPANVDGVDSISGFATGDVLRFSAAPPALTGAGGNCGAGTGVDNMTYIATNGGDTCVIVDLDTGAGQSYLVINLTGATLDDTNFVIQNTTDIARTN